MSGTIIERLSSRKLAVVIGLIVLLQVIAFLVGAIFGKTVRVSMTPLD